MSKHKSVPSSLPQEEWMDPVEIRFQHARIRPTFSGCGRGVTETLEEIRSGILSPDDLPPIQVLVVAEKNIRVSLNNRRLWVLKRCREEGWLKDNKIRVRVRSPKSEAERNRYALENCSLEAKFMREPPKSKGTKKQRGEKSKMRTKQANKENSTDEDDDHNHRNTDNETSKKDKDERAKDMMNEESEESDDSDEDDSCAGGYTNPFSALAL